MKQESEEEKQENSARVLGIICGLFTILGLWAAFLYPQKSSEREEFILGWKITFFIVFIISVLVFSVNLAIRIFANLNL